MYSYVFINFLLLNKNEKPLTLDLCDILTFCNLLPFSARINPLSD